MAHIGSYLKGKLGGHKAPRPPRRDYDGSRSHSEDSESEESYLDPTTVHPTEAPVDCPIMPSYPPPRPNHSPVNHHRVQDPSKRCSFPVMGVQQNRPPIAGTKSHRPQSAEHVQLVKSQVPNQTPKIAGDDYCEPWDAKPVRSADTADYWDPCDKIPTAPPPVRKSSKDDYIDPYDAKKDVSSQGGVVKVVKKRPTKPPSREQEVDEDNEDSYDDPYDTGKVTLLDEQSKRLSIRGMRIPSVEGHQLTERDEKRGRMNIDKAQSPSRDQRPADDYDTPWESKSPFGIKQMSPSANKDKPQAPSSDNRPADDYEKPWEWNKKSPLNGHLQPLKPLDSHQSPKADARRAEDYDAPWEWSKSKNVGGMVPSKEGDVKGAVAPKKPPRTFAGQETAIDPTLPLEQQGWYHGPLKRLEAETLLRDAEDCSFLLRNSESSKNDFSLSVKNNNSFMHLKIVCANNKYILGQFSKPFDTVPEMIHYYSVNKLNIKGAIHKKLLHPLLQMPEYQTLEPLGHDTAM